jgi:Flp pilus assembly protein TadG
LLFQETKLNPAILPGPIADLIRDRSGSILPMVAVMGVFLTVAAGAGVDFARAVNTREKLAHALDAAALTLAAKLSTSVMTDAEIKTALEDMLSANMTGSAYLDTALANLSFTVDSDEGLVDISTKAEVSTDFIRIGGLGPDTLTVSVGTEVSYSRFDVELALVLDVTGSMKSDIDTLQDAAEDLVDILIPDGTPSSDSKVRISIVPYSQGVNLGSYASTASNGNASGKCVTERLGEAQYTDDPYNYTPDDEDAVGDTYFGGGSSSCPDSDMALLPLTNDRHDLLDKIDDLDDGGSTAGQTGIAWGWYTLSPNWTNLWPTDSDPESYDDDDVLKFAIIMTDGDNNTYYDLEEVESCSGTHGPNSGQRPNQGSNQGNGNQNNCTTSYEWDAYSESESYNNESSTRARALCEAMKDKNITIYGIYFGSNSSSAGAKNMSACSTSSSTYYQATSSSDLISAFGNIAKKIQSIYLSR